MVPLLALFAATAAATRARGGDVCATFEDGVGRVVGRNRLTSLRLEEGSGALASRDDQLAWSAAKTQLAFDLAVSAGLRLSVQVRGAAVQIRVDGMRVLDCDGLTGAMRVCETPPLSPHGAARVELTLTPGGGDLRQVVVKQILANGVPRDIESFDLSPLREPCAEVLHPAQHLDGMWCASVGIPGQDPLRLHFPSLAFPTSEWPFAPAAAPAAGALAVHGSFTARIAGDGDWADFRLTAPPGTRLDINGRKICEVEPDDSEATGGAHMLSSMENVVRVSYDAPPGPKTLHLEWRPATATAYVTVPVGALTTEACVVDCLASPEWTPWSPCPATCERPVGTQVRNRPVMMHAQGGVQCSGTEETRPCEADCGCRVSPWGGWSPCNAVGQTTRTRSVMGTPSGKDCPALSEVQPCAAPVVPAPAPPPPPPAPPKPPPPPPAPPPAPAPCGPDPDAIAAARADLSARGRETLEAAQRAATQAAEAAAAKAIEAALAAYPGGDANEALVKEAVEKTKKIAAEEGRKALEHAVQVAKQLVANRVVSSDAEADAQRAAAMASALGAQNKKLGDVRSKLRGGPSRGALRQQLQGLRSDAEAWPPPPEAALAAAEKAREALADTLHALEAEGQGAPSTPPASAAPTPLTNSAAPLKRFGAETPQIFAAAPAPPALAPAADVLPNLVPGAPAGAKVVSGPPEGLLPNIITAQVDVKQAPEDIPPAPGAPLPVALPGPVVPSRVAQQVAQEPVQGSPPSLAAPAAADRGAGRDPPALPTGPHPAAKQLVDELNRRWTTEVSTADQAQEEVKSLSRRVQALAKLVDRRDKREKDLQDALSALGI